MTAAISCRHFLHGGGSLKFTKMHGLGNDYIILECMDGLPKDIVRVARMLSDRHFGVGSDGVICICSSLISDFAMRMFNADGSEGEMCGNGIRCVAKYLYDRGLTDKVSVQIETLAGIKTVDLRISDRAVVGATVDMGKPFVGGIAEIYVNDKNFTGIDVSMGNPHFVISVSDAKAEDVSMTGRSVECHPRFASGVNVEFISVLDRKRIVMRVWERGSGETLACGTGACAAVAAAHLIDRVDRNVVVELPGGELEIMYREHDGHMLLTGPAVTVFDGWWYENGE